MTLDLTKIASQIADMVIKVKSGSKECDQHLQCALDKMCDKDADIEGLIQKISSGKGKITFPVAGLTEKMDFRYPSPDIPEEYVTIATDGSHIDLDRNKSVRCFVINIGSVLLKYGAQPEAFLESVPRLYCDEDDLVIKDETEESNKYNIDSTLLGIKRGVEECKGLAEMASALPPGSNAVALLDGTLVLWNLGSDAYPGFVTETLLHREYLTYFDEIRKLNDTRNVGMASYISLPRSAEVVNALRIAICPQKIPNCSQCPVSDGKHACDIVSGVQDYMLFSELLKVGERSALFYSQSKVVNDHYGEHTVYYFYLRVNDEVARVEIPAWVAKDKGGKLLELTHALVLDQCRRGHGYPVVLSEAHEKAVVTGADREEFWKLVEEELEGEKILTFNSIKSRSKRTRWI